MDPVKAAQIAYEAASKAYAAHQDKLYGLKIESSRRIDTEHRDETNRLGSERALALRAWEAARIERALGEDTFPVGTKVVREKRRRGYSWDRCGPKEFEYGVVEVYTHARPLDTEVQH